MNFQAKTLFANRKNEIAIAHVSLTTSKREDQIQFLGLCASIVRKFDESVGKRSKRMWRNSSEYKQILTKLKIPIVYKRLWKSYLLVCETKAAQDHNRGHRIFCQETSESLQSPNFWQDFERNEIREQCWKEHKIDLRISLCNKGE